MCSKVQIDWRGSGALDYACAARIRWTAVSGVVYGFFRISEKNTKKTFFTSGPLY